MGRSYSAPKPVREFLLVRQLQIILGEKLFGPQARLRITPIAWFEPATLMISVAFVARPRLPLDHPETAYYISINCRCREFWNTGLGGRVRKFVWLRVYSSVSGHIISHKGLIKPIETRNISVCRYGGRPRLPGLRLQGRYHAFLLQWMHLLYIDFFYFTLTFHQTRRLLNSIC